MILSKPYLLGTRLNEVNVKNENIDIATFEYEGSIYIIAVNMEKKVLNVEIDLSKIVAKEKPVSIMFESRKIKLISGKLVDKFNKYDVHIYKISK